MTMVPAFFLAAILWFLIPADASGTERGDVYRAAKAATVLILAVNDTDHSLSIGSGFFTEGDGLLLTNAHVIEDSHRLFVYVHDREVLTSPEVVAFDPDLDLAALRIRPDRMDAVDLVKESAGEGQDVIAVGYPRITDVLQLGFMLHATIVPATTSGIAFGQSRITGRLTPFIQTAGIMNFGNSGGPLVHADTGEVLGMVTTTVPYMERAQNRSGKAIGSVLMKSGINYSIPAPVIRDWLISKKLLSGEPRPPASQSEGFRPNARHSESDIAFATGHLLHTMATVLHEDADFLRLAERHYQTTLAHQPDARWAVGNLAQVYGMQGKWEQAMDLYLKLLDQNPEDPKLLTDAGWASQRAGQKNQALALYQKAVVMNPRYGLAHINLGTLLWEEHRLDEAITEYRLALSSDSSSPLAAYNLGLALEAKNLPREAMGSWESFLERRGALPDSSGWVVKMREAVLRLKPKLADPMVIPARTTPIGGG